MNPAPPVINSGLANHPSLAVSLRHGWRPGAATSRTGSPAVDILLNIGQQYLPRPSAVSFQTLQTNPGQARRYGNEFYASAAGRTPLAEQLAAQSAQMQGLLGALQNGAPQLQPFVAGMRNSLLNPEVRSMLGGVSNIL